MARYNSENQVLEALNINSLQNMSQNEMEKFVSMLPDMDRKVAVGMVSKFPAFDRFAADVIRQLNGTCDRILGSNDSSQKDSVGAYKSILSSLQKQVESDDLSFANKQAVIEQMITIADHIALKDSENKDFLDQIHKRNVAFGLGMGVLVLGALALGVAGVAIYVSDKKERELLEDADTPEGPIDISVSLDEPHVYLNENALIGVGSCSGFTRGIPTHNDPWANFHG